MGIGLGTGYLSPVKTLILWFSEQKGLATGLAIAVFYFIMMFIGHLLLAKPEGWVEVAGKNRESVLSIFKNKTFLGIWIMFYINITCGLALISQEKSIINAIGLAAFAGLTGNQVATYIVNHTGTFTEDASGKMVNPTGYQNVLLFTAALCIIAMLICMFVCSITAVTKSDSLTLENELKYDMI